MVSSKDEFYKSVLDIKEALLQNGLSKISADNLEKLFHYFQIEYPKIPDGDSMIRTNDRVNSSHNKTKFPFPFPFSRNEHDDNRSLTMSILLLLFCFLFSVSRLTYVNMHFSP
jgi:hypothetical protein